MERRTSFSKRIFSIMLSLLMVLSMMLYFPSGIFSNISFGLKASAEGTTNDFTLSAVAGDPKGNSNEEYTNLFDGNTGTKWCFNFSDSAYVIFKASEPAKFSTYSIATGNDTASSSGRNPVKWTLSACMNYTGDTTSWTVIDTVTDGGLPAANETYTDFTLAETTPFYQYFKLEVTQIKDGNILQISEIALKDYTLCEHQWEATGETIAPTCTEVGYDVYECSICHATKNKANGTSANGHSWLNGDVVAPTCTEHGYTSQTCSVCGAEQETDIKDALGHDFVDEVCTRCGVADTTPKEPSTDVYGVYRIGTAGELYWFAACVNGTDGVTQNKSANAVLTADITVNSNLLGSLTYDSIGNVSNGTDFTSWTPIGNDSNRYFGTFDGQGHTVSGLYFNNSSTSYVGLFGYVGKGGEISNVGVENSYFNGKNYVGGVCGVNELGAITNCYNTSAINGSGYHVGGVCGENWDGTITNCYNTGEVSGNDDVGGVCGNNAGTITHSYYLETCNAEGTELTATDGTAKTAAQFASGEVCYLLNGADDVFTWRQNLETDASPVLDNTHGKVYASYPCPAEFSNTKTGIPAVAHNFVDGKCSVCGAYENETEQVDGVYQLKTMADLYWFAEQVNSGNTDLDAVLVNDITVNTGELSAATTDAKVWTPIGNNSNQYIGTFDGQGHTISGLYFNDADADYVGLFGYVESGGKVSNVGVENSYFNGDEYVGGVCGENYGTITNCYNTSAINGSGYYIGGVCGDSYGTITNCYNTGEVSGYDYVGGVCGYNDGGTITNCYNTGNVSGTGDYVGGVCGINYGTIPDCYNTGTVSGFEYVGGVCGFNVDGTIESCYNTGAVSGTLTCVGGVCGVNFAENGGTATITNCYNTGAVSGASYVGGVCGSNDANSGTAEITNCYNTGNVTASGYYALVGGVCGENYGTITNCYNTGNVTATSDSTNIGGVCGWSAGTITNCYYDSDKYSGNAVGEGTGTVKDVKGKTTAQFNRGEVAYLLSQGENGSVWGQTLTGDNKQDYPVLGGKKVLTNIDQSEFANDVMIYGQSVTLDGTIGMNIYVAADDDYEWTASFNGEEVATSAKDENGLYKFTYQVAAKDMDENINFNVNDKIDVTVSVSDYLAALSETDNESLKNLAESMSAYGDASKAFFSGGTVAEQTITDDLSVYDFTVGTMPEGISYYGSSLVLESETTIRHYFKLAEGKNTSDFAFMVGGKTATLVESKNNPGYYCIDIQNVSADELGTAFTVSINGEDVITNYSALSYANKVLSSDSTDDNLKNLVKALYLYNNAAIAYMN